MNKPQSDKQGFAACTDLPVTLADCSTSRNATTVITNIAISIREITHYPRILTNVGR